MVENRVAGIGWKEAECGHSDEGLWATERTPTFVLRETAASGFRQRHDLNVLNGDSFWLIC